MTTYIIVGDGAAGHNAAATIREQDEEADIHVFTEEPYPFYDRIGLRAYIRQGRSKEDLIINSEDWYAEQDINLHLETEVIDIDREDRKITTADDSSFTYDKLLLAVGGTPRTLPLEKGVENIHHLWYLDRHGEPMKDDLEDAEHGVVIGGGLLGFDLIGSFADTDIETTYLIREAHWWPSVLDADGAEIIHDAMRAHGVDLHLEEEATALEQDNDTVHMTTNRSAYETDVIGIAVGHVRNLDLAEDAGLDTNRGIVANQYLQASDPDIFTAGDVAEYEDMVLETRNMGGSWVIAQEQGEHVGENMVRAAHDEDLELFESVDTYTVMHFGLNVASLGDPRHTDDHDVLTVVDEQNQQYRKLVLEDYKGGQRIVGAAIIGAMQWMYPLKQLIRHKVDVSEHVDSLQDADFDLKSLL